MFDQPLVVRLGYEQSDLRGLVEPFPADLREREHEHRETAILIELFTRVPHLAGIIELVMDRLGLIKKKVHLDVTREHAVDLHRESAAQEGKFTADDFDHVAQYRGVKEPLPMGIEQWSDLSALMCRYTDLRGDPQ